jgi:hypothetical protein
MPSQISEELSSDILRRYVERIENLGGGKALALRGHQGGVRAGEKRTASTRR